MFKHVNQFLILSFIAALAACGPSESPSKESLSKENPKKTKSEQETPAAYVEQASFTDFEGNKVPITKFKGKVVLIDFWETWCKPCIASFPTLQKLQEDYSENFVVLAVTPGFSDTQENAESFAQEHDYDFVYLMDSNKLSEKLGVQALPYKVYVDAEGNFVKSDIGSSGSAGDYKKIKRIIEKHKKS